MIPLFERYPKLMENIPFIPLGNFPTPVVKMENLGKNLGLDHLYVKRDDRSSDIYGGNKVRKLEFLLGEAIKQNKKAIITFGCAGSNHTLATTLYSKKLKLRRIILLLPQPNSHYIRKNLLMSFRNGADLHYYNSVGAMYIGCGVQFVKYVIKDRRFPKIIMPGGSTPVGTLGFVNAAFELKKQIDSGEIPEPDYVYFPVGTVGTAAGFTLGAKAAGLRTKVISVRVTGTKYANAKIMFNLVSQANGILTKADTDFPKIKITEDDIHIRHGQFGLEYALFTKEGMAAVSLIKETEGITLDGTYTGKALASLIEDSKKDDLSDKVILFWNTYNSVDFSDEIKNVDYKKLPSGFHRYFEEKDQPLDDG